MLYFAYGSNLNIGQMSERCPAAVPLGKQRVPDRRLVFRGVADCIYEVGAVCYGGVWRITKQCEEVLDRYEGVRNDLYRKEYIPIKRMPDGEEYLMVYVMNSTGIFPPSEFYLKSIRQGYKDFGLSKTAHRALDKAVAESWDDKAPTHRERQRHMRTGRPSLALPPRGKVKATSLLKKNGQLPLFDEQCSTGIARARSDKSPG